MKDWSGLESPIYFCAGDEPGPFQETSAVIAFRLSCLEQLSKDPTNDIASYQAWLAETELKDRAKCWSMLTEKSLLQSSLDGRYSSEPTPSGHGAKRHPKNGA
ncbi:MAG: hypothetical protein R3C40_05145 [Parvularculaceae bacterium]